MARSYSQIASKAQSHHSIDKRVLNPKLWTTNQQLIPKVRESLFKLANLFAKELGINEKEISDVRVTGSNASFTWHPGSDLDVTLVLNPSSDMSRKRFKSLAKLTSMLNYQKSPTINSIDTNMFLAMRGLNNPPRNQSIYSAKRNEWLSAPSKEEERDPILVKAKASEFIEQIKNACEDKDLECHKKLMNRIKAYRARGLKREGEYSFANAVYRAISKSGELEKLKKHVMDLDKLVYQMTTTGSIPKRNDDGVVPVKESELTIKHMMMFAENDSSPTNLVLWDECKNAAARQYSERTAEEVVMGEAINLYHNAKGRWYVQGGGEPVRVQVNVPFLSQLMESRGARMLEDIASRSLMALSESTYSASTRRVYQDLAKRGGNSVVGIIEQDQLHGENGERMVCSCCRMSFYPDLSESIYRATPQSVNNLDVIWSLVELFDEISKPAAAEGPLKKAAEAKKVGKKRLCPPGYVWNHDELQCVPKTDKDDVRLNGGAKDMKPSNGPGYNTWGRTGVNGDGYAWAEKNNWGGGSAPPEAVPYQEAVDSIAIANKSGQHADVSGERQLDNKSKSMQVSQQSQKAGKPRQSPVVQQTVSSGNSPHMVQELAKPGLTPLDQKRVELKREGNKAEKERSKVKLDLSDWKNGSRGSRRRPNATGNGDSGRAGRPTVAGNGSMKLTNQNAMNIGNSPVTTIPESKSCVRCGSTKCRCLSNKHPEIING